MVTFIVANSHFDLISSLTGAEVSPSATHTLVAACLVGLVGAINVWITWFYMQKSDTMRDWVVLCAWTHRIKFEGRWLTIEQFLEEQLGCQVTHGMSEEALRSMRQELDGKWRKIRETTHETAPESPSGQPARQTPSSGELA